MVEKLLNIEQNFIKYSFETKKEEEDIGEFETHT
jgi:hypothetical protein